MNGILAQFNFGTFVILNTCICLFIVNVLKTDRWWTFVLALFVFSIKSTKIKLLATINISEYELQSLFTK